MSAQRRADAPCADRKYCEVQEAFVDPDQGKQDKRSARLITPQYFAGSSYCSEILIPLRLAANPRPASAL